ncbi:MAG: dihydropteroate synthase [Endomicrobia bacterium]|nr:dihydropteroate synthase [Endomicrobiia bacterium]MCL2799766.1 dihydropteroate synthase [Endomicrobiia bacterium]
MLVRKAVIDNFADALNLVKKTGCDSRVYKLFAKKAVLEPVIIEKLDNRAANILKQEALAVGADAAVSENISRFKRGFSDIVLFATVKQLENLTGKLRFQPFGLKEVSEKLNSVITNISVSERVFRFKNSKMVFGKPAVMGIINMDPDSFSGDGLTKAEDALKQAMEFEKDGAQIIDIGAESSRPGVKPVDAKTEIKRLIPALKKIKKGVKIPVSIDTYKYETAKAALCEGADIINDIYALRHGKGKLAKLIASEKAGVILMHMRGTPVNMQKNPRYKNCTSEVFEFLEKQKKYAESFGIKSGFIAVDPGIGFGKTAEHNMELVKNTGVFSSLGAVVAGVSRKKFIKTLQSPFVAANFLAVYCGADIIRVHDVKETVSALNLINQIRRV